MKSYAVVCSLLLALGGGVASCSSEAIGSREDDWDSAGGNPTHPTHSLLAEIAIKELAAELPEVSLYASSILEGANLELHDLKAGGYEALRLEIGGNNWAADHPEILWERARGLYAYGDKARAFFYVGILLHYVQDMGVPAHAFHVYHQSSPANWDHTELLAFFHFNGDLSAPAPQDPKLVDPVAYVEWSAQSARDHFHASFPGATYHREFLPPTYAELTDVQLAFLRDRESHCAHATAFALRSAASALTRPHR
jgi:hypothetical protein